MGKVILVFLLLWPGLAQAQWSADPAQAGATAFCDSRNQGQSLEQAEAAAIQAMAEFLQLASGPVLAALQVGNPALMARWRYLASSLCPASEIPDAADGVEDGSDDPGDPTWLP